MLQSLAAYNHETGRAVHCRIGVAVGPAVAGVLGRLQPRLHLFGKGLRAAEEHEKSCSVDAVHASGPFLRAITRCRPASFGYLATRLGKESGREAMLRLGWQEVAPGSFVPDKLSFASKE